MCEAKLTNKTNSYVLNGLTTINSISTCSSQKPETQINTQIKSIRDSLSNESNYNFNTSQSYEENTLSISQFPMLIFSPQRQFHDKYKKENTPFNNVPINNQLAFSNNLYKSPPMTKRKKYIETLRDKRIDLSLQEVYVCCISYKALNKCEMSIDFMDRFELISQNHYIYSDLCFVRNMITNQSGFVPKYTLCKLSEFLNDMRNLKF